MTRARLLLADDHRIFAEGLASLLSQDHDVIGIVEDGEALVAAVADCQPDLALADISMPRLNGIDSIFRLRGLGYDTRVLLLTMHSDIEYATAALEAGASGYVLKSSGTPELRLAIAEALKGGVHVSSEIARDVMGALCNQGTRAIKLTPRQRDVLQGLAQGMTAKEIAASLHVSPRTVESHKYQLMDKVGASTSAELIKYALRHGIGPV